MDLFNRQSKRVSVTFPAIVIGGIFVLIVAGIAITEIFGDDSPAYWVFAVIFGISLLVIPAAAITAALPLIRGASRSPNSSDSLETELNQNRNAIDDGCPSHLKTGHRTAIWITYFVASAAIFFFENPNNPFYAPWTLIFSGPTSSLLVSIGFFGEVRTTDIYGTRYFSGGALFAGITVMAIWIFGAWLLCWSADRAIRGPSIALPAVVLSVTWISTTIFNLTVIALSSI